jgi:hypothetical protein
MLDVYDDDALIRHTEPRCGPISQMSHSRVEISICAGEPGARPDERRCAPVAEGAIWPKG